MNRKMGFVVCTLLVLAVAAIGVLPAPAQQPQGGAAAGGRGGPGGAGGGQRGGRGGGAPLLMTTTAFEDGGVIPAKFVGGMGVSPELKWSQVPMGTQSFVLLFHDPEPVLNNGLMDVTHWLVWNIPATSTGLPEGMTASPEMPDGTRQVSLRSNGYMGPGAGPGPYHHYTFELYAVNIKVDVPAQTNTQQAAETRKAIMAAIDGHIVGKAMIVGRFHQ
jgi:Raf kinase inhibitor-like YbhB/YbcL family protein